MEDSTGKRTKRKKLRSRGEDPIRLLQMLIWRWYQKASACFFPNYSWFRIVQRPSLGWMFHCVVCFTISTTRQSLFLESSYLPIAWFSVLQTETEVCGLGTCASNKAGHCRKGNKIKEACVWFMHAFSINKSALAIRLLHSLASLL